MLVLPLKPALRFELGSALQKWLDDPSLHVAFQPSNPLQFILPKPDFTSAACKNDLQRLQSLRHCLSDCLLKPEAHANALDDNAIDDCQEYHAVLLEFEKRGFPAVEDASTPLPLTWKGAFLADDRETHATLVWDRVCIAYNFAALRTFQMHTQCSPTNREDCKRAVSYGQQAASVLQMVQELCQSLTGTGGQNDICTVDLSPALLQFWRDYLLAEAQQFIYRMAALAETPDTAAKHATLSKLAQSAKQLFQKALQSSQDPRLQSELPVQHSRWAAYCKSLAMLCAGKADYHRAVVYRLEHEHGREIAQLRDCHDKFRQCQAFFENLPQEQTAADYPKREVQSYMPVLADRIQAAEADNHRTYHDPIPTVLPELEAKQLAQVSTELPAAMLVPRKAVFENVSY